MKKTFLPLILLAIAATCFAETNPYLKFISFFDDYDSFQNSIQSNYFVFHNNGFRTIVLSKANGFPVLVSDKVDLPLLFDETDSSFITEYFKNGVRSVEKKDKHGNVTSTLAIPDTFPVGPSYCQYLYDSRPIKTLYSLDKRVLKYYDLENKERLATFSFPTQEAWDEVQGASASKDRSRLRVAYTFFDIYYDMETGDSLFTRFHDNSSFRGFSKDGKCFFVTDSVFFIKHSSDNGAELCRWEDSLFLQGVGFLFDKSNNALILHTGDTLFYMEPDKPLTHHNKPSIGTMFRVGDEIMYFDEINLIGYKYNGDTAYSLKNSRKIPIRYSQDESLIASVEKYNSPIYYLSTKTGVCLTPESSGNFSYNLWEYPLSEPYISIDSTIQNAWFLNSKALTYRNLESKIVIDSIKITVSEIIGKVTNQNTSKMLIQDTSGKAFVVDLRTKEVGATFDCPAGIVKLSPDGNTCLAVKNYLIDWKEPYAGYSIYNTRTGVKLFDALGFNNAYIGYGSAAFAPDSRSIAIADSSDTLRILSTADGSVLKTYKLKWAAPFTLNYTPDGKHIVYSSSMGEIATLDAESGRTQFVYNDLFGTPIRQVIISPSGKYMLAMSNSSDLAEWAPDWNYTPAEGDGSVPKMNSIVAVPNPARASVSLTIGGEEVGKGTVEVFSSLGERCYVAAFLKAAATAEISIDCSTFAKGAYFARATVGGRTVAVGKFVVE